MKAIALGITAALALLSPVAVNAAPFELIYTGGFNSLDSFGPASGTSTAFSNPTPFTINAWFDTSSPNLAPPIFPGFVAYDPSAVTISFGGTTYTIQTIGQNPTAGASVAIFDSTTPFGPGHYAAGILQEPPQDGAGIIGDFTGASPAFSASNLVPTTFTGFYGVGYGSGVCTQGSGGNCQANAVTPFVLSNGGQDFLLTLGNYDADYPSPNPGSGVTMVEDLLNTAQLVATPEPATFGLAGLALVAACGFVRRKRT